MILRTGMPDSDTRYWDVIIKLRYLLDEIIPCLLCNSIHLILFQSKIGNAKLFLWRSLPASPPNRLWITTAQHWNSYSFRVSPEFHARWDKLKLTTENRDVICITHRYCVFCNHPTWKSHTTKTHPSIYNLRLTLSYQAVLAIRQSGMLRKRASPPNKATSTRTDWKGSLLISWPTSTRTDW